MTSTPATAGAPDEPAPGGEGDGARRRTTQAVTLLLFAAAAALGVGAVLGAGGEGAARSVGLRDLARLPRASEGWLSLGVVALLLTPSVRVGGMLVTFAQGRRGRAFAAGVVVLAFLVGALVGPAVAS